MAAFRALHHVPCVHQRTVRGPIGLRVPQSVLKNIWPRTTHADTRGGREECLHTAPMACSHMPERADRLVTGCAGGDCYWHVGIASHQTEDTDEHAPCATCR
jgi:hypothetical protein